MKINIVEPMEIFLLLVFMLTNITSGEGGMVMTNNHDYIKNC